MRQRPKPYDAPGLTLIERTRRYRCLTLRELEQYTGLPRTSLARIMQGYAPDVRVAIRLARFFNVTVEDLWGEMVPVMQQKST